MNNIFHGKFSRNESEKNEQTTNTFFIDENEFRVREVAVCVNELKFRFVIFSCENTNDRMAREQKIAISSTFFVARSHRRKT